ncbi:MAG: hypothetical protein DRQ61_05550 [Gammaproteobacteria bacterium]|nr:MAG: hypothetical protein DRQ61_05550 [Gammaproteobacteria bacterium]
MAEHLKITESTAKTHVAAVPNKLNVHSRAQAALYTSDFHQNKSSKH